MAKLYGGETAKAVANFKISGEPVPAEVIHWLGRIKGAAAEVNGDLGLLDRKLAKAISGAAAEVASGAHDRQFPIDVFQTGSGTSSNMNANEVIAKLAGAGVHPNDHVNMGQSSNDVFPSAVHLAALDVAVNETLPALKLLEKSFAKKASQFKNVVKAGRVVPVKWSLMTGDSVYVEDTGTFRSLTSQATSCSSSAPLDAVEESYTSGSAGLRYDSATNQFIFNWQTSSSWKGKCRTLVLELADGQRQQASFRFQ